MRKDTAGKEIYELMANCNCGLTAGCSNCRLYHFHVTSNKEVIECQRECLKYYKQ